MSITIRTNKSGSRSVTTRTKVGNTTKTLTNTYSAKTGKQSSRTTTSTKVGNKTFTSSR